MRRRGLTMLLRGLLAAVLVVLAWTGVVLLSVRGDLTSARTALEQVQAADDLDQVQEPLAAAERDLRRSAGRLDQPGPSIVAAVPLVGRTVRALQTTTGAALAVTEASRSVLAVVDEGAPLLQDGRIDLARLAEVERALARAADRTAGPVQALVDQELGLVPGQVASPARTAQARVATVPEDLSRAAAGLRGLRDVLGGNGPRNVLVLLENNAELRATGGIVTVFAEAQAVDGRLVVERFRDVVDVADRLGQVRTVQAPADYTRLYGSFLAPTTLWRNTNMSPDVPTSSAVLADVAALSTGRRPDAVLWVDVPSIAAVLRATGPTTLPDGSPLTADNAVPTLLSTAYLQAPDTPAGQEQRRAVLRGAADAVLGDLLGGGGPTSATSLARELFASARGRHLAVWSADATVQEQLREAGVDGGVRAGDGDLSSLAVHNLGGGDVDGNKLDFYGRRQSTVEVALDRDQAQVTQVFALRNTAPRSGLPVYVSGRRTPGVANSLVSLAVPAGAQDVSWSREGARLRVDLLPEGDHQVLTDTVSLTPGTTATWTLRYRLPVVDGRYRLALVPQPLAVDAGLSVTVRTADGLDLEQTGLDPGPDGDLVLSGPYDAARTLEVRAVRPGWTRRAADAVRRFWSEPVSLG